MQTIEIDYAIELIKLHKNEEPFCERPEKNAEVVKLAWYKDFYFDNIPYENMIGWHYKIPTIQYTEPEDLASFNVAHLDESGKPVFTCTPLYCRNYHYDDHSIVIVNLSIKDRALLGLRMMTLDSEDNVSQAIRISERGRVYELFDYTYSNGRCIKIEITVKSDRAYECKEYVYDFKYGKKGEVESITQNDKDVVYRAPKSLTHEKALKNVMSHFAKDVCESVFENEERPGPFVGISLLYGIPSRFSSVTLSLIDETEHAEILKAYSNHDISSCSPSEFENSIDVLPVSDKAMSASDFLKNHWYPDDSLVNTKMNEFAQIVFDKLKKKYKTLKYFYVCDYECLFLEENLKRVMSID